MVAAATMSLPERAKLGGDYDYRYAWIRDQCHVGQAVAAHGPHLLLGVATVRAVQEDLARDGYVYRFRHDDRSLGAAEGAFLVCGFWLALAGHQQGDTVGAARRFERNRASCGPPGLFTEEYDVKQRQLRGNLPQAFVHGMLLECSARMSA
jgi:GH15 family glucan-1,4-alpha-glucosidase